MWGIATSENEVFVVSPEGRVFMKDFDCEQPKWVELSDEDGEYGWELTRRPVLDSRPAANALALQQFGERESER